MAVAPRGLIDAKRPVRAGRLACGLLAACACAGAAAADGGTPWLLYRDANPFVAASGLPYAPPSAAPGQWRVEAVLAASNTELGFVGGRERLLYDGEIHEARVALTRAFGDRWLARATLGGTRFGTGVLDGFIEDFHRTFGFGHGDRGRLGSDGHTVFYDDGQGERVRLDRRVHTTTPLLLDAALRRPAAGYEWLYGATLKLPTSHASPLIDDRATDLSLWLAAQSTGAAARWPWGARVGVMQRGNTRLLPQRANERVPFADAVLGWRPHPRWDIAAQLQWHGAAYDSRIPFLQSAATLSLSAAWHSRAGWTLRAGLVEDAIPRHAQDVTFFLGLAL